MRCQRGKALLSCRSAMHCRLDGFELYACCGSKPEECKRPGRDRILVSDIRTNQERKGIVVAEDKLPMQSVHPTMEAEWHEQTRFGSGDREERQLANIALKDHWALVGNLPLKAYPPTGVKAGFDKSRGKVVWKLNDATPRGCAPSLGRGRCFSFLCGHLGLLLALPLSHQFWFGGVKDVSHLLPVGTRQQEVRVDDLVVQDMRTGGVDDRQPNVAAHDHEPLLSMPQQSAKTFTEAGIVLNHLDELATDIAKGNLIDDRMPLQCAGWR